MAASYLMRGESIVISQWPKCMTKNFHLQRKKADMTLIMDAVSAVRNRRAEMNVPPSKKARVIIVTERSDVFESGKAFL